MGNKKTFWDCVVGKTSFDFYVVGNDNKTVYRMSEISLSWDSRTNDLTLWDSISGKKIFTIMKSYEELQTSIIQSTSSVKWCLHKEDINQCCIELWQKRMASLENEAKQYAKLISELQASIEELSKQIQTPSDYYQIVNHKPERIIF